MVVVHHLNNSHSFVVLWLMEELGLDYEIVDHQRHPETRAAPPSLRAVHPAARSPTIEDHGVAMIESTGIILYLVETYGGGRLRPAQGTADAMRFFQWLTYLEGSVKAPLSELFRLGQAPADDPRVIAAVEAAAKPFGLINAALEGQETLIPGMFTAADIQLTFHEELIEATGQIERFPAMGAHLTRMREREGYRRAAAKGGVLQFKRIARTGA